MSVSVPRLLPVVGSLAALINLQAVETEQVLTGELLIEGISQNNYLDGDSDAHDRLEQMWIRCGLGTQIKFEDSVALSIGFVYQGIAGDDEDDARSRVALNEAYIDLRQFLRPELHLRIGRQPVSWNLRPGRGGFLYDSRADNPEVNRWDGVRAYWEVDNFTLSPFGFIIEESSGHDGNTSGKLGDRTSIYGIAGDWQPDRLGDDRLFFTGMLSIARNVPLAATRDVDGANLPEYGRELHSYSLGVEMRFDHGIDLFAETVFQSGDVDSDTKFKGLGLSVGMQWQLEQAAMQDNSPVLTLQYDHLSGHRVGDRNLGAFVAPWEGVSDTLIVEHERYGELSGYMLGNLDAFKLTFEQSFGDPGSRRGFTTKAVAALYRLNRSLGGSRDFGQEYDLTLTWHYNEFTSFGLFGGIFLPGDAFREVAPRNDPGKDMISIFGLNGHIRF